MAVSFIQSLFGRFGAGLVAPGTGVVLQNRGACFAIQGGVVPGTRPYHTIVPGLLLRGGAPIFQRDTVDSGLETIFPKKSGTRGSSQKKICRSCPSVSRARL